MEIKITIKDVKIEIKDNSGWSIEGMSEKIKDLISHTVKEYNLIEK